MKCFKSILSVILTLAMILSVAAVPGFAATEASIKGEELIYLPGEDAVKLNYTLLDASGKAVEDGVTYSVSSAAADYKDWLDVDAETGDVFVKGDAAGKAFTVKAETASFSAEMDVETAETILSADFEDGNIPAWIYNDKVTISVKENNGKKYLNVPCGGTWATTYPTIRLADKGISFVADHMTFEMDYMISHKTAGTGSHPSIPLSIAWTGPISEDTSITNTSWSVTVNSAAIDANGTRQLYLPGAWKSGSTIKSDSNKFNVGAPVAVSESWYDEATFSFKEGFEFDSMKIEIKEGGVNFTAGGSTTAYTKYKELGMTFANAAISSMNLSGAIDNISLYTGERTEHEFNVVIVPKASIAGDDVLYLPGTDAVKVNYKLVDPDGNDVSDYVLYAVSSDDENQKDWLDVNRNTGEVYVKGDATGKSFTVTGTSANWSASKTVTISDTILYSDFEDGQVPSWITSEKSAITVKDNGESKYLNAPVAGDWGTTTVFAGLKNKGLAVKTDYLSFESKFMITHKNSGSGSHPNQPFTLKWENINGIGNGKTTVNNTAWTMPIYSRPYDEATSTRQLYIPGAWNNGGNVKEDSNVNAIGDPIRIEADWYDETTRTFNEGFEYSYFKAEVEGSVVYTNVNGVKNTYTKYRDLNLDLNGAELTTVGLGGAYDDILIYTGKKVNYVFGVDPSTRSTIDGDCMLYLPGDGAVKLNYSLVDPDGNAVTENVTYNVISEDPNSNEWVEIDSATGDVFVKGDAFGKSFMVSATSSTYSASQIVEISETALKADFEDGKVPSWIYSDKVVVSVKDNNGNKYLNVPCASGGNYGSLTDVIRLKNQGMPIKSNHLSFESKFMISHKTSGSGEHPHQPFTFKWENERGIGNGNTTVNNTMWGMGILSDVITADNTRQMYIPGAWNNAGNVVSDSNKNKFGSPIAVNPEWYDESAKSFNQGFEFADFKVEVKGSVVYTTLNGAKTTYTKYRDLNLDLNGAEFTTVAMSGVFDDILIYTGEKVYHEFGIDPDEKGSIKGDSYLYLPGESAVKLQYGLIGPDGTEITEGVTYSLYCEEENYSNWLEIDSATGDVYIAGDALGKSFIVIARTDDCYASQKVEISKNVLFEDFEDGKIPSWIYSDKAVLEIKDNGDNKYLPVPAFGDWANINPAIRIKEAIGTIKTSYLSFETKFMITTNLSGGGTAPHQPFIFYWENENGIGKPGANISNTGWTMTVNSSKPVDNTRQMYIPGAWNNAGKIVSDSNVNNIGNPIKVSDSWYDKSTSSFVPGFEFASFKLEVTNDLVYATVDGKKTTYTKYRDLGMQLNNANFTAVALGGAFDDILIYTGEKVSHIFGTAATIDGDSVIARATAGITAVTEYTASYENGNEIPETAVWKIADSYNGVSVSGSGDCGKVYIKGEAPAGAFTILVENEGKLIASKEIKISDKLSEWTNDKTRYSVNFEDQKVGDIPRPRLSNNYDDHSLVAGNKSSYNFSSKDEADAAGVEFKTYNSIVKEEANGNKYVSSTGYLHWSKDGATLTFNAKNSLAQGYPNILDDSKIATLEGRVMFESENIARLGLGTWSVFYQNGTAMNFDIRYGFLTKDQAFITLNMKDGKGEATARDVAYVPADEWIDVRVEFDNSDDTFDFYVNGVKVIENEKHSIPTLYSFFGIGCAVDDLVFYSGAKDAEEGTSEEFFKTFKDGEELSENVTEFVWNEATAEGKASSVAAAVVTNEDLSGKSIITAIYNSSGKLVAIDLVEATKNASGSSLAKSKIQGAVSAGSRAKVFLWDMESIKPVK